MNVIHCLHILLLNLLLITLLTYVLNTITLSYETNWGDACMLRKGVWKKGYGKGGWGHAVYATHAAYT